MTEYRLISSDNHITEPADLWKGRVDPKFQDRAPVLKVGEEFDEWIVDDKHRLGVMSNVQPGLRFDDPNKIELVGKYDSPHLRGLDPDAQVSDMDVDGVEGGVLYPSVALSLFAVPDSDLVTACMRGYNDYVAEFAAAHPNRLKAIALVNIDDVQEGVAELQRCANLGMVGAMIAALPLDVPLSDPMYDPLWAAFQDLDMSINFHTGCARSKAPVDVVGINMDPVSMVNKEIGMRRGLSAMMFAGVFERFPKIRAGSVEFEVAWAPFFIERMDYYYRERPSGRKGYQFQDGAVPSDFWRRNCFISFQEDAIGMKMREYIGVDNLCWGSDYPHAESTFPRSRQIVDEILKDVPEDEKAKIAALNTARIFHFDP